MYELKSLPKFDRVFKKFHPKEKESIRKELYKIKSDPTIGELKKGPLDKVRVHKFKIHKQLFLLAYEQDTKEKVVYLYAMGSHENFYDKLKRYIDIV